MGALLYYAIGGILEVGALYKGVTAPTYEAGAYWFSIATYVAVFAVSVRQVNGFLLAERIKRATPSEAEGT